MSLTSDACSIHYRGRRLEGFDAVIPRIGASVTFYGTAVVRQFEIMGVYCLNESVPINRSRDKLRSHQILAQRGIDLPATGFAHATRYTDDLIDLVGGPPLVVKLLEGTQGVGVVLADTRIAARSVIEAFRGLDANILVQEYVAEAAGADIRCLVVGERVAAAMKRTGRDEEFRANLHRGGRGEAVRITPQERRTAVTATRALGLRMAGVDILRSARGPLVVEVNSSPGLRGVEESAGVDVADRIIRFLESDARPGRRSRKEQG